MLSTLVLSLSVLFQFLAAFIALYTIKITKKKFSWILIAAATLLMGIRRIIPLYHLLTNEICKPNISNEIIGLLLSLLLFFGILGIRKIFIEWNLYTNKIENLYNEKSIILKEVHHRIKNNITTIQSMLNLQADAITNAESRNILQDAISRVHSMKIMYDKLLLSDNYTDTSTKYYFEELISAIISIFPEKNKVALHMNIDDFLLNVKILLPLGTIVNELITNSMKYAFINKNSGIIDIHLSKHKNEITLSVQDDGIGLPENFYLDTSTGFGFMLVKLLTQQLKGALSIENNHGAKCSITFKV